MSQATPWQLGLVSTILRALARGDRSALKTLVARPSWPRRMFTGGSGRIARTCAQPWCREALAPWGDDAHPGPRRLAIRERGSTMLACFAEREADALVLVIARRPNGDAKLEDVRVMKGEAFAAFGSAI